MSWTDIKNYDFHFYSPLSYAKRSHKLCRLPNGILTLLISDPDDKTSACSLSVATGSHNDPRDLPGLAHLCEHMLLAAGSKQYPDPGLYHELISKHDGFQNAFTTGEQTTFYFEIPNMSVDGEMIFDQVLNVFSSFFINPLFNPIIMNKEIYSITSEHDNNMSSTTKILYHATRLLANNEHPFCQFSTGNIHSLSSIPSLQGKNLRNILIDYFKTNFFASRMTLCIRGPQTVNALTKLAISKFGSIKSNNSISLSRFGSLKSTARNSLSLKNRKRNSTDTLNNLENFKILEDVWEEKYNSETCFKRNNPKEENLIFIKSDKHPVIRFLFPVSRSNTGLSEKEINVFSRVWCDLFGDESRGSLCYFLVDKGLITECFAYTSEFCLGNKGLILELALTDSGWVNVESISRIIFEEAIPAFVKGNLYNFSNFLNEQNIIDLIRFLFQDTEKSPMEECSNLSGTLQENLQDLNISYLFKGSTTITDTNINDEIQQSDNESEEMQRWWLTQSVKFQNFLKEYMNLDNVKFIVMGKNSSKCSLIMKRKDENMDYITDLFYEFDYYKTYVDLKKSTATYSINGFKFKLPPVNQFIPKSFNNLLILRQAFLESSLKSRFSTLRPSIMRDEIITIPHLVSFNSSYEMWILKDSNLESNAGSKTILSFELFSLNITPTPENTIHLEILAQVLFILLSSDLYPSLKLGYTYEISASNKGEVTLRFTVSGFAEGISVIIYHIVSILLKLANDSDTLLTREISRKARVLVRTKYEDAARDNCVKLGSIGLLIVLEKYIWPLEDRMDALEETEMTDFKQFCSEFLQRNSNYLTLFIQGNITYADEINETLDKRLTGHLSTLSQSPADSRILKNKLDTKILEPSTNYYVKYNGASDDPNNCIVYFIQTGLRSDKNITTLTLFTEYLLSTTLVPDLRIKKQIGYVVLGGMRILCDTVGIHITVMSNGAPMDLEDKINQYMEFLEFSILKSLDEIAFQKDYANKFLELLNRKSNNGDTGENSSGPANLLNEIIANVQNGDSEILNGREMKQHQKYRNQISEKEYQFNENNVSSHMIDKSIIEQMTLSKYMEFFKEKLSINSKSRSKLSIMIESPMTEEEITDRKMFLQLEAFLKIKGLVIKSEELRKIVKISQGSPSALMKNLFNAFRNKNEGWKLCSIVLKEIFSTIGLGLKQKLTVVPFTTSEEDEQNRKEIAAINSGWRYDVNPTTPLVQLDDANAFR